MKLPLLRRRRPANPVAPATGPGSGAGTTVAQSAEQVLRRLEWTVIKRLDGRLQGDVRTLMRGGGLDLADLREYQSHDDVRHIDWHVTARLQTPYVRQYHEDRDTVVWFLVDASASVGFGSGTRSKQALARDFAAVLARLFTRAGHRVAAVIHAGGGVPDRVLSPRGGRDAVLGLVHALMQPAPERSATGDTDLSQLLRAGERAAKRRGAVFVLSDFISEPGWEAALGRLALRHELMAVRVLDPWDRELPMLGLVTLRDAETGENLLVDFQDAALRKRFANLTEARSQALQAGFARAGVDALELATDEDLLATLQRYTALRRLRQRRPVLGRSPVATATSATTAPAATA